MNKQPDRRAEARERRTQLLAEAKTIAERVRSEGRTELSHTESAEIDERLAEAEEIGDRLEADRKSHELMDQLNAGAPRSRVFRDGGLDYSSATTGHLALSGVHAKQLGNRIIDGMPKDHYGTKALFSPGTQTTSIALLPQVVTSGQPAQTILDLLPSRIVPPVYTWLLQSVRDLHASVVAPGASKPESIVSVAAKSGQLRVVATVSEPIDQFVLADNENLATFVSDQMLFAVRQALEAQVLNGIGTDPYMTGILNASGIYVQAFDTSALTSIRRALAILDVQGFEPLAIVLDATTWANIELLETTLNGIETRGIPIDSVERRLWGTRVTISNGMPAKTGWSSATEPSPWTPMEWSPRNGLQGSMTCSSRMR